MKILALLLALSAPCFAEYVTTYVNGRPVTVWVNTCGNNVWTSGTVNGTYVNTYTTNYGNSSCWRPGSLAA